VLWPCPQFFRPDWKGFPSANPIAYWASSSVTKEKSFFSLTPGHIFLQNFFLRLQCSGQIG
jgi:hypothetical protein